MPPLIVQNPPSTKKSKANCYHDSGSNPGLKIMADDLGTCTMTVNELVGGLLRTEIVGAVEKGGG